MLTLQIHEPIGLGFLGHKSLTNFKEKLKEYLKKKKHFRETNFKLFMLTIVTHAKLYIVIHIPTEIEF